jgi:hypothetical protein
LPTQGKVGLRLMRSAADTIGYGSLCLVESDPVSSLHRGILGVIGALIRLTPPTRRLATIFWPRLLRS